MKKWFILISVLMSAGSVKAETSEAIAHRSLDPQQNFAAIHSVGSSVPRSRVIHQRKAGHGHLEPRASEYSTRRWVVERFAWRHRLRRRRRHDRQRRRDQYICQTTIKDVSCGCGICAAEHDAWIRHPWPSRCVFQERPHWRHRASRCIWRPLHFWGAPPL